MITPVSRRGRLSGSEGLVDKVFDELVLSKRDVARDQLDLSIHLIFRHEHYVAANTLAWAASDVLMNISKHRGIVSARVSFEQYIKPEFRKQWRSILRRAYTFSKHADLDPEDKIRAFRPEATVWTIMNAIFDYSNIFGGRSLPMLVFHIWFMCRHPDVLDDDQLRLATTMAGGLGHPANQAFKFSTVDALEMLENLTKYPSIISNLPTGWADLIEN
jgi:hypothetical protein